MADKIKLKQIVIKDGEGRWDHPAVALPRAVTSWAEARRTLRDRLQFDCGDGPGYYKHYFTVEWENGDCYQGRADLTKERSESTDLSQQVQENLRFSSGEHCPSHLTEEQYQRLLGYAPVGNESQARAMLVNLSFED